MSVMIQLTALDEKVVILKGIAKYKVLAMLTTNQSVLHCGKV